jgi:hypothetical protein
MESANITASAPPETRRRNMLLLEALLLVLVAFVTYTTIVALDYGLVGFIEAIVENSAVLQVLFDLMISASIALAFVYGDARRRGLPFWPYFVATVALGSIGLLAYLVHRTWRGLATGGA